MKLLIGVPTTDFVHVEFLKSLTELIMRLQRDGINFKLHIETGTLVYCARDTIASKAINEGYTHVLWLDSDMVFTDDLLDDLMFCGKPFVCGIFHSRRKGYHSALFKNLDINNLERFEEYPPEAFRVAGCGFAGVLIETSILRDVMLRDGTCFLPMRSYGEDLAFCMRAASLGHEIYAEPSAVMGHVGHITIYPEDHEKWKAEVEKAMKG